MATAMLAHPHTEEHMAQEEEDGLSSHRPAHLHLDGPRPWELDDATMDDPEQFVAEYDEEDSPQPSASPVESPNPVTPGASLTGEEKRAYEEKKKKRKKFAEMRYLVNTMFRCRDCMLAPTDMEQGFDGHAPPRRPAARPSAGPGSEFCCAMPALTEALPADFPIDLIPLTHSYLLNDAPSRSFLTTSPLPSQGTIQCYIVKTNTRFELYLEMKNQDTFVKMRQAKEEYERKKAMRLAGKSDPAPIDPDVPKDELDASSAALPPLPPVMVHSQSMPLPQTLSLDDEEAAMADVSQAHEDGASSAPRTPPEDFLPGETPADLKSPTNSLDYEKLFPERPVKPAHKPKRARPTVPHRPRAMSLASTPELKGAPAPGSAAAAFAASFASERRMSEPGFFSLGPSRMMARRGSTIQSSSHTPQRRLSVGSSNPAAAAAVSAAVSAALPPSESNVHLHNTRTNAINTMLKQHSERIIGEGKDIFLLCAQRKRSWSGNHYIISSDRENIKAEGPSFYGKLKSNFGGTEFVCCDNGTKSPNKRSLEKLQEQMYPTYSNLMSSSTPRKSMTPKNVMHSWLSGSAHSSQPHVRHELACVLYDHFFEHTGSPIRIKVLLPNRGFDLVAEAQVGGSILKQYKLECERQEKLKLEAEAKAAAASEEAARKKAEGGDAMTDVDHPAEATGSALASSSSSSHTSAAVAPALGDVAPPVDTESSIDTYENLRPVWHDGMNAYVLHFDQHRVREKSVKNFRIVRNVPDPKTPGATQQVTVLQFGRVLDRNTFVMDFGYPLSPLTAFMICLSSIDPKLAV